MHICSIWHILETYFTRFGNVSEARRIRRESERLSIWACKGGLYAISEATLNDQVHGALNYKTITKQVIRHVEQGHFQLLEKLVHWTLV